MLQLILGRAGSGKTTELYRRIGQVAEAGGQAILLVPEQFTSSTEGRIHRELGDALSGLVESFSFTSLAEHILSAEGGSADLAQHIPTYETVLDADPEQITGTGYDDSRGGIPCIYVEVSAPGGERVDRYWISVESGLLISSETLEGEELLYRMTAYSPIQSCPSGTTFQLPDGTVLHSI